MTSSIHNLHFPSLSCKVRPDKIRRCEAQLSGARRGGMEMTEQMCLRSQVAISALFASDISSFWGFSCVGSNADSIVASSLTSQSMWIMVGDQKSRCCKSNNMKNVFKINVQSHFTCQLCCSTSEGRSVSRISCCF